MSVDPSYLLRLSALDSELATANNAYDLQSASNAVLQFTTDLQETFQTGFVNEPVAAGESCHASRDIDKLFMQVDEIVRTYLRESMHRRLVKTAFVKFRPLTDLMYGIVLQNDCIANRKKLYRLLDFYAGLDMSEKIPVYFQVIPDRLAGRFSDEEFIS
jgi:hypothetical protein